MKHKLKNILSLFKYINKHPLARRHLFKAYYNFFTWQLSQALVKHEKKVGFTDKTSLLVKKGMTGATGNIYLGLHEFNDMGFLLHLLRPNDIFFDIGANVGSYTVLASGHCGAITCCIEPIPSTFRTLQSNIAINKIESLVTAKNIGLSNTIGKLEFTKSMDTVNHVISDYFKNESAETIEVQVFTGDSLIEETDCPLLIKIDVEGFETNVLNGMNSILSNEKLCGIIIELNGSGMRYGFDEMEIHKKLLALDFNAYGYDPFARKLLKQNSHGDFNTIYLRNIDFITDRLNTAKKVNIFSESF